MYIKKTFPSIHDDISRFVKLTVQTDLLDGDSTNTILSFDFSEGGLTPDESDIELEGDVLTFPIRGSIEQASLIVAMRQAADWLENLDESELGA